MEVQSRAVSVARPLTRARRLAGALAGTRAATAAALAVTLAAAATIAFSQPFRAPWWFYADADATYTASSLNVLAGRHTLYIDHPGLPTQELLAATFAADALYRKAADGTGLQQYVDEHLLDFDQTRWAFRGWAMAFFIGGAALTFFLLLALFGHWSWALAGGLLWLGQPDGAVDAIQIRPDVLLTGLCLLAGFLVVRAYERHDALRFAAAALTIGFAAMVKLHAVGLLVPLLAAAVLARLQPGWPSDVRRRVGGFVRRRRLPIGLVLLGWFALAVFLNRSQIPFSPARKQLAFVVAGGLIALYTALALRAHARGRRDRLLDPFPGILASAFAAGIALPVTLLVDDGLRSLVSIADTLRGQNVNRDIRPFQLTWDQFTAYPLRQALVVFALAGIAAIVALRRRDLRPGLWFLAAAVLGVMAAARLSVVRYYAPAFVVAIPAALWLFQRAGRRLGVVLTAALVAYVVVPQFQHRSDAARQASHEERIGAQIERVGDALLRPGEVMLTADYAPVADARYFGLIENFVERVPPYPYRFLADVELDFAAQRGLQPRYYAGPVAAGVTKPQAIDLSGARWLVRPVPQASTREVPVVELVRRLP